MQYIQDCFLKRNRITVGILMLAMCSKPRGYGRNFDKCDISACGLNPERNPEKYGRPMNLALTGQKRTRAINMLKMNGFCPLTVIERNHRVDKTINNTH